MIFVTDNILTYLLIGLLVPIGLIVLYFVLMAVGFVIILICGVIQEAFTKIKVFFAKIKTKFKK